VSIFCTTLNVSHGLRLSKIIVRVQVPRHRFFKGFAPIFMGVQKEPILVVLSHCTMFRFLVRCLLSILHPLPQSTVLIHSANVVSGIPNVCFRAATLIW
jgi:hypothetical protein